MARKGVKKRSKFLFKKGNNAFLKRKCISKHRNTTQVVKRLDILTFQKYIKKSADGVQYTLNGDIGPRILRPKLERIESITDKYAKGHYKGDEMRLLQSNKVSEMYNTCFKEHALKNKNCKATNLIVASEEKRGLAWKQSLKCVNCSYISRSYKLYQEVKTSSTFGSKAAAPNLGLQVALQDMPIGNTKARLLFAGMNTPPPSRSSMQKLSNKVSASTERMNEMDMNARLQSLREFSSAEGTSNMNVSIDCRYNANTVFSRGKMGQSASQSLAFMIENNTNTRDIVGVYTANKLCWTGAWLRNRGYNVTCPGHVDCTANYQAAKPFSEYCAGKDLGNKAVAQNILIEHVTTDGDGRAADGVAEAMAVVDPLVDVKRQDDPIHLGQCQFRRANRAVFSQDMFGEAASIGAEEKKQRQKLFSLDVKSRCHLIFEELFKSFNGNVRSITKQLCKTSEVMLECYSGNHKRCRRAYVCCSGGVHTNWFLKSYYLRHIGIKELNMTDADKQILLDIIELKLSIEGINAMKTHTNTNKNEASHRAVSVSLPKNVNFSRNFKGRVHSTAHRLNAGAGNSLLTKLEFVGAPVSKGGAVAQSIVGIQKQSQYHKEYQSRATVKSRKAISKDRQINDYLKDKFTPKGPQHTYSKAQLYRKPKAIVPRRSDAPHADHEYSLRPLKTF